MTQSNIPRLRFSGFEGAWDEKKLGDLLEFKNGINAAKEQYGRGVKFINVLDILNNDFITHDKIVGSVDVTKEILDKYPVQYGDILFQRSSETREEVGSASVYLDKEHTATFGGFVIRGKEIAEYEPIFLNKLLKTDAARDNITSKSGGSTRYNVGQDILSSVVLSFPSLPEQQKIASFLIKVDEKLTQFRKKKELLEQYKKGIMQKIFSQEIRFKDDNGEYPNWKEKRIEEVAEIIGGGTPDTSNTLYWNGNIEWFTPTEIKSKYSSKSVRTISQEGLKNSSAKLLPIGTILLTTRATIGEVSLARKECTTNQGFQSLLVKDGNDNVFIYYWILKNKNEFVVRASGSTFLEIGKSKIAQIGLSVPVLKEQIKIANFLSVIDKKIDHTQTQIDKAEQWKNGLLQQMFV